MLGFVMLPPLSFLTSLALAFPVGHADDAARLWAGGVQQVFERNCLKCHGLLEQKAGLQFDSVASVLKGGKKGLVVVPGQPENSKLLRVLAPDADPHMPPKKQLGEADVAKLRAWVTALGRPAVAAVDSKRSTARIEAPKEPTAAIDHFLAARWRELNLTPAPACDDRTFVRRVTLDLIGRIPTQAEANAFLYDAAPDKRSRLVDRLLAGDEAARHFRETWDTLLMGRVSGRREDRRRDSGWYGYLERAFQRNRPWDQVVRDIITARSEQQEDRAAAWFLYERRNEHQKMAEAVAPVIYGTRIDCAQCHDHPLAGEIKQGHYWGLVAAFSRSRVNARGAAVVLESAVGGHLNFTNLKKESQPAAITLLTGHTIDEPGPAAGEDQDTPDRYVDAFGSVKVPKYSRRAALAEAATRKNPLLARSFVNHIWALLLGRGFVDPPDEMNSKHPPSHPELLDWLASDFAGHGYDVKRLMRAIVLSRGYQLAPWTGPGPPLPEAFAAAAEKPLSGEAIARSALIASGRSPNNDALRRAIVERFPEVLPRTPRATIQQAMLLAYGEPVAALFQPDPDTAAARLAVLAPEGQVRKAFRLALIREPDSEELAGGVAFLKSHSGSPAQAIGQLLWALVTGPEFLTNH